MIDGQWFLSEDDVNSSGLGLLGEGQGQPAQVFHNRNRLELHPAVEAANAEAKARFNKYCSEGWQDVTPQ
jgi:hypothetical protein